MCGIVAVLPLYQQERSVDVILPAIPCSPTEAATVLAREPDCAEKLLADLLREVDTALESLGTVDVSTALCTDASGRRTLATACSELIEWVADLDRMLDTTGAPNWDAERTEAVQCALRQLADRLYSVLHDRVIAAEQASALAPGELSRRSAVSYLAVETALEALSRLEVRGRDSAGLSIWVRLDELDRKALASLSRRRADPLFRNGSVTLTASGACFAYKHAALVGKLGHNIDKLRYAVSEDTDLHRLLSLPSAAITVLAHTRWASVGRISEENAHPVSSDNATGRAGPFCIAALNGDIDNYRALEGVRLKSSCPGISTDAKIIPALLSQRIAGGDEAGPALRACLGEFTGSMAIVAQADGRDELLLAAKGTGQSLHVGLSPGGFVVASEVYGLVAATKKYLRVEGSRSSGATRHGTVLVLPRSGPNQLPAIRRWDGNSALRPIEPKELRIAEVTTRDLELGPATHYLQKEIYEAPSSFRKTLRGRLRYRTPEPTVSLSATSLPSDVRKRIRSGDLREVFVIGQGTAAVASRGVAQLMYAAAGDQLAVTALPASEFSAWRLRPDMTQACVVAVSQSGTTTDTNRSVDLARERGATVLSIVNRRESDLAAKSHGVLYTSDGRDVEMSVASTKAFYAQVAAGCLLGVELGRELGVLPRERQYSLLTGLKRVPDQLCAVRAHEDQLTEAAAKVATRYPYWAVVGSGPNKIAAAEIRIKLSELCYKTVSTDVVEDKKHIDLSAEALVVVCVAGAPRSQISDLVKEVEILAAHGNTPLVLCDEGTEHMWPTDLVVGIPRGHREMMWIATTAAGHLFAYHAARCIDASANPLRIALSRLEDAVESGLPPSAPVPQGVLSPLDDVLDAAARGRLRGVMTSQTALELTRISLQWQQHWPFSAQADGPVKMARAALTRAIEELGRPIDSVKHQAKTVTVGTSRDGRDLYSNHVVTAMKDGE